MKINHVLFLDSVISKTKSLGIDIGGAMLDHIAYQTESSKEYDKYSLELKETAKLIKEPIVGGRRVGVFKLSEPLVYKNQTVGVIELIEPKDGQNVSSGLEHAEYLLPESLEEFMKKYPNVDWNTDALNRDKFPMLILNLTDAVRVKFPRFSILSDVV